MSAPAPVDPRRVRADEYRRRGWWRDETFLDDLRRQARHRPHHLAIAGRRVAEARTDTLDYAELLQLTERFARALAGLGVRRGDFVAVQLPNRWEMVPLIFACARVGAVICPISPVCPEDELRHRLALTEARVCVTIPGWAGSPLASTVTALSGELATLEKVFVVGGPVPDGARDFHDHFVDPDPDRVGRTGAVPEGRELGPDDPFVVLFTSGTTGESKGVLHSQNTVHSAIRGYVDTFGLGPGLVAAVSTPCATTPASPRASSRASCWAAPSPSRTSGATKPSSTSSNGTGPPFCTARPPPSPMSPPRSAPIPATPAPCGTPSSDRRPSSRTSRPTSATPSEPAPTRCGACPRTAPSPSPGPASPRTGPPTATAAPSTRWRSASTPPGRTAPWTGWAWLRVRGASLALGYHKRDDVYAAEFGADGWFDTGDLARADGDGGIRIVGRARDAVVRDGTVAPMTELEAVIGGHPTVTEAALVGLPGPGGDTLCAVVVPSGTGHPALDELRAHVERAGLDRRFLPERLEVVTALPKTLTGKVRKAELRARWTGA